MRLCDGLSECSGVDCYRGFRSKCRAMSGAPREPARRREGSSSDAAFLRRTDTACADSFAYRLSRRAGSRTFGLSYDSHNLATKVVTTGARR